MQALQRAYILAWEDRKWVMNTVNMYEGDVHRVWGFGNAVGIVAISSKRIPIGLIEKVSLKKDLE